MNQLVTLLIFFISMTLSTQELENHLWKNRVLLIYSADKNSEKRQYQLELLSKEKEGLEERKLVVYSFDKNNYTINFKNDWKNSNSLFKKYVYKNDDFVIWLLGLDGNIKLEQTSILHPKKLFAIIDAMPMRKKEIKKNN